MARGPSGRKGLTPGHCFLRLLASYPLLRTKRNIITGPEPEDSVSHLSPRSLSQVSQSLVTKALILPVLEKHTETRT